jgi:small subunit ribosomal protein S16
VKVLAVKLRLARVGAKKAPFYRIVAADSRSPRDGRFLEIIGRYNPRTQPSTIVLDIEKAHAWIAKGAEPTETVAKLIKIAETPAEAPEAAPAKETKLSKKAQAKIEADAKAAADAKEAAAKAAEEAKAAAAEEAAKPAEEPAAEEAPEEAPAEEPAGEEPAGE